MERTVDVFVEDMLKKGRKPLEILAIARSIRKGVWRDSVELLLLEKKLLTINDIEESRANIVRQLKESWKKQMVATIAREKLDKEMKEKRAKLNLEKKKIENKV